MAKVYVKFLKGEDAGEVLEFTSDNKGVVADLKDLKEGDDYEFTTKPAPPPPEQKKKRVLVQFIGGNQSFHCGPAVEGKPNANIVNMANGQTEEFDQNPDGSIPDLKVLVRGADYVVTTREELAREEEEKRRKK